MPHQQMSVHIAEVEKQALDPETRQALLRLLAGIPGIMEAVRTASAGQTFRAVMSVENAKFFTKAKDGFYKMGLHNGKHIVENVKLEAVSPDYAKTIADLSLSMTLAAIVAKLDAIQAGIADLKIDFADAIRGESRGALDALASAAALSDPVERRQHMLGRCLDVEAALGKLAGQLRSHVRAMPSQKAPLLSGLFNDGLKKASAAFTEVEQDMVVFGLGFRELIQALRELEEPEMARVWMHRIAGRLEDVGLHDALLRARLVPIRANRLAPEERLASFLPVMTDLKSQDSGFGLAPLTIEFDCTELLA